MTWTEEASATDDWTETSPGAFQRGAFQEDAFLVSPPVSWTESASVSNTFTEESAL